MIKTQVKQVAKVRKLLAINLEFSIVFLFKSAIDNCFRVYTYQIRLDKSKF